MTRTVDKPWGHELIWAQTERYVGKILHIKKGHRLSLQYHVKKDETVMVLSGKMAFEHYRDGESPTVTELGPRVPFHVSPGLRHRMIANFEAQAEEVGTDRVLLEVLEKVPEKSGS